MTQRTYFPAFTTPIRGHGFAGRPPGVAGLRDVDVLRLEREPDNPRDDQAVAVWARASGTPWRIGYLERSVARRLAPRLERGESLEVVAAGWMPEPNGRWQRPAVRVRPQVKADSVSEDRLDGHERAGRQHPLDDRAVDAA